MLVLMAPGRTLISWKAAVDVQFPGVMSTDAVGSRLRSLPVSSYSSGMRLQGLVYVPQTIRGAEAASIFYIACLASATDRGRIRGVNDGWW